MSRKYVLLRRTNIKKKKKYSNLFFQNFVIFPDLAGTGLRQRLLTMVATCLKTESNGDHKKIESLIERQDWLDNLRQVMYANLATLTPPVCFIGHQVDVSYTRWLCCLLDKLDISC